MSTRRYEARRTLWLSLPVFALASWGTAMALPVEPRLRLYFSLLAGTLALGVWVGLRRWRRAPGLTSGFAVVPDVSFVGRVVVPALAGIAFWPWLLIETVQDMRLANRLRAFVPPENRASSFGFGEASLAFACVAAAFTLGTHGLSRYTPVAGKLWEGEAKLANRAQEAVRQKLGTPMQAPVSQAQVGSVGATQEAAAPTIEAPKLEAPKVEAPVERAAEAPAAAIVVPPLPEVPEVVEPAREGPTHRHSRRHEPREEQAAPREEQAASVDEPPAPVEEQAPATAHREEPEVQEAPRVLDRRYVPGSEMAKKALSGQTTPEGYVTSSGRRVIKAPPPSN